MVGHAGPLHALPPSDRTRTAVCGAGPLERTPASWDLLSRDQRCPDCLQLTQGELAGIA